MADSEAKVVAIPAPAPLPGFRLTMDVITWGAVHAHLLASTRIPGASAAEKRAVVIVLQTIGAALVRKGAITVEELERCYSRHMLAGGDYYGPASKHVQGAAVAPLAKAVEA